MCWSTTGAGSSTCSSTSTRTPTGSRTSWSCSSAVEHRNVCVVGDSDQSIYRFRGADIRNILEFEKAFPDATVIVLEQNYRSTQTILDAANAVIANNLGRKPKELWTDTGGEVPVVRYHADDENDEAQWVAHEMSELHDTFGHRWGDLAVFYRTNAQSRVVEEHLMRAGHPLQGRRRHPLLRPPGGQGRAGLPAGRGEPGRRGQRQAGPQRAEAGRRRQHGGPLDAWAKAAGVTFAEALDATDQEAGVSGRAVGGIESFLAAARRAARAGAGGPGAVLETALERSGYVAELEAEHTIEAEGRLENLAELVGVAREFEDVDEFLEQVSLVADTDDLDDDDTSAVLMTLHSAKGLEFPVVFLIGHGGRRLPPPPVARRARRAGGGAPPRLRRHHPGP